MRGCWDSLGPDEGSLCGNGVENGIGVGVREVLGSLVGIFHLSTSHPLLYNQHTRPASRLDSWEFFPFSPFLSGEPIPTAC